MKRNRWAAGGAAALLVACGARVDEPWGKALSEADVALSSHARVPAYCPGQPTRHLLVQGNLDPRDPILEWDATRRDATSNFALGLTLYAKDGLALTPSIYFGNGGGFFGYHVALEGSSRDLGSGALYFDEDGTLRAVQETVPFRLPGRPGFEPALRGVFGTPTNVGGSGLDGMTAFVSDAMVTGLTRDGAPRLLGYACPDGSDGRSRPPEQSGVPLPDRSGCAPQPTRRVSVRANLAGGAPILALPRRGRADAEQTSFATTFLASDATGMVGALDLHFRRITAGKWEYRVLLQTDGVPPELGRGVLAFDAAGVLAAVDVAQPLRFPSVDERANPVIALDFGTPTSKGGSGVDGVTALPLASYLISLEQDGEPAGIAPDCSEPRPLAPWGMFPPPLSDQRLLESYRPAPACAGSASHFFSLGLLLDTRAPLARGAWDPSAPQGPSDVWASVQLTDPGLREVPLEIRVRRVAAAAWELHALTNSDGGWVERASLRLESNPAGMLSHIEGTRSLALPLPDGRDGPPIELELGTPLDEPGSQYGSLLAAEAESWIGLWTNGTPAQDCSTREEE